MGLAETFRHPESTSKTHRQRVCQLGVCWPHLENARVHAGETFEVQEFAGHREMQEEGVPLDSLLVLGI